MSVKRILPEEALALITREGYAYVDVRTEAEFALGHPRGAFNVPLHCDGPRGRELNRDFRRVMEAHFRKDAKLVIGCHAGARSLAACRALESWGFTALVDQRLGFGGVGGEPGWSQRGLPVAVTAEEGHSYASLTTAAPHGR